MPKGVPRPEYSRQIHIKLTERQHKQLRIRAAELDISIQDFVENAIAKSIKGRLGRRS